MRRGEGGGGGSDLFALVLAPVFPRLVSEWVAPFAPSWVPPFRCWSVAGNAGACGRSIGGALRAAALTAAAVFPPLDAAAPPGGTGLLSLGPASVRSWAGRGGRRGGGLVP